MAKWLTTVLVVLALVGGALAGTPIHAENSQMAKCCKKAKSGEKTPEANAARLCCATNCSLPAPSPGSSSQLNFSPSLAIASDSVADRIAGLFHSRKPLLPPTDFRPTHRIRKLQPKYIQHHSFLI